MKNECYVCGKKLSFDDGVASGLDKDRNIATNSEDEIILCSRECYELFIASTRNKDVFNRFVIEEDFYR
ncbi:hypothetical protein GF371_04620 [Candidatus Woesearchaeota archaeon]|nr:hypothetical protein [Candidatus Woesearchaeota archaeon]